MIEFLIIVGVILVCSLLFGKADTKREVLNLAGLDLEKNKYEEIKAQEFERNCIKALMYFVENEQLAVKSERDFLILLREKLFSKYGYDNDTGIKDYYISFAEKVVRRRGKDLNNRPISDFFNIDNPNFKDKHTAKIYIKNMWREYQYPWPQDWINQKDLSY